MGCTRCGAKTVLAPKKSLVKTLEVFNKPSAKFARISTMERFIASTPSGNLTLEPGQIYIFSQSYIDELEKLDAPIWTLK